MLGDDRVDAGSRRARPRFDPEHRARTRHRRRTRKLTMSSSSGAVSVDSSVRRGRLAIALQEALTTVTRLRSNKQVATDSEAFRVRIKQVLSTAEQDARAQGYGADDVRFAL